MKIILLGDFDIIMISILVMIILVKMMAAAFICNFQLGCYDEKMQASKKAKMISSDFKRKVHFLLRMGKKGPLFWAQLKYVRKLMSQTVLQPCINNKS